MKEGGGVGYRRQAPRRNAAAPARKKGLVRSRKGPGEKRSSKRARQYKKTTTVKLRAGKKRRKSGFSCDTKGARNTLIYAGGIRRGRKQRSGADESVRKKPVQIKKGVNIPRVGRASRANIP